jgi:hypothetical protein
MGERFQKVVPKAGVANPNLSVGHNWKNCQKYGFLGYFMTKKTVKTVGRNLFDTF